MLWNRFCPGFPLRFGFRFRQLVDSFFCQMAGFLHGMVGVAVTDAALHEKTADFDFFDYEADETKPVD